MIATIFNQEKESIAFRIFFICWFLLLLAGPAVAQHSPHHLPECPAIRSGDQIIRHFAYTLCYDEPHEQARWVAYELTLAETNGPEERASGFFEDPAVTTGSATDTDYAGSGYDRGHLAPAGDMTWSDRAMHESFYYSNMSPQVPSFNRGIWKKLETLVRAWAQVYDGILIATGPLLEPDLPTIGPERVSIPTHYYKVILDGDSVRGWKSIGFIMANAASAAPLQSFAVSVDEVERITGIDFFPFLPDGTEERTESVVFKEAWNWNSGPVHVETETIRESTHPGSSEPASIQCTGITKAGTRCHNHTTDPSGRCHLHR